MPNSSSQFPCQSGAPAVATRARVDADANPTIGGLALALLNSEPSHGCCNPEYFITTAFAVAGVPVPLGASSVETVEPVLAQWVRAADAAAKHASDARAEGNATAAHVTELRKQLADAETAHATAQARAAPAEERAASARRDLRGVVELIAATDAGETTGLHRTVRGGICGPNGLNIAEVTMVTANFVQERAASQPEEGAA
jgi:hypothetical protein